MNEIKRKMEKEESRKLDQRLDKWQNIVGKCFLETRIVRMPNKKIIKYQYNNFFIEYVFFNY